MALGSAPPPLPLLAFYLISSPLVAPLSPAFTHVCLRKGRSPWCAPRLFRARLHALCIYPRAPARLRFARECVRRGRKQEGRTERAGWDGNSCAAATTHRSTIGFRSVKCHVGITPRYDNQCELILILPCVHWFVPLSISPFFSLHFIRQRCHAIDDETQISR